MSFDILIVDDSRITRALIARTLKLANLPIGALYEAGDGQAALETLAQHHVDLVLADLHMPKMSGAEMTARILANEQTRDVSVVVISAEPDRQQIEQLKRIGIKGYLRKPFTPEELSQVLTELLGVSHA